MSTATEELGPLREWPCQAYEAGPDEPIGAELARRICFTELAEGLCDSRSVCEARMGQERQRVWRKIHEAAALGDDVAVSLAAEFTDPEQLLNGALASRDGESVADDDDEEGAQ